MKRFFFLTSIVLALAIPEQATAIAPSFNWYGCGTSCLGYRIEKFEFVLLKAQAVNVILFFSVAFVLGLLVRFQDWPVGYTRKILALILYVAPFQYGYWWTYTDEWFVHKGHSTVALTLTCVVYGSCIAAMSSPIRKRVKLFEIAFLAIDRPEDRPHTIAWLLTSILALWLVLLTWQLSGAFALHYAMLALFISGVGDALAEPIGLKYGRHKYSTSALGTSRRYTRSLEGSACVFACAVIGVIWVHLATYGFSSNLEFFLSLLLFPIVATIAEAKSPHTWDQPFIVASCALTAFIITTIT